MPSDSPTTLRSLIAAHEARRERRLPSTTYVAGGVLSADRWGSHLRNARLFRVPRTTHLCSEMVTLASAYDVPVGQIVEARHDHA